MADVTRRLEAIRARLNEEGLDALLVQSAVNRRYLSGFTGSAGALVISPERSWIFVDFRYVERQSQAPAFELVSSTPSCHACVRCSKRGYRAWASKRRT